MWHTDCYTKCKDDNFPALEKKDIDNLIMGVNDLELDGPNRF